MTSGQWIYWDLLLLTHHPSWLDEPYFDYIDELCGCPIEQFKDFEYKDGYVPGGWK